MNRMTFTTAVRSGQPRRACAVRRAPTHVRLLQMVRQDRLLYTGPQPERVIMRSFPILCDGGSSKLVAVLQPCPRSLGWQLPINGGGCLSSPTFDDLTQPASCSPLIMPH
uniref:Uncharacterized protein n=1 Tax=Eutreptiella gymnastica TaxID=73025 RepID=A0A7S4CWN6_9EUGL